MPGNASPGLCLYRMTVPGHKKSTLKVVTPEGESNQWMIKEVFTRDNDWKYDGLLEWQHGGQKIKVAVHGAHSPENFICGDQKYDESGKDCTMSSPFVQSQEFQSTKTV